MESQKICYIVSHCSFSLLHAPPYLIIKLTYLIGLLIVRKYHSQSGTFLGATRKFHMSVKTPKSLLWSFLLNQNLGALSKHFVWG